MTLKEKLALPIVRFDMGSGNIHMVEPIDEVIRIDAIPLVNVDYIGDFSELPFEDGIADEIHSRDSLEHVRPQNYHKTLKEWNRILKMGGLLAINTPNIISSVHRFVSGELSFEELIGALYGEPTKVFHQHYMTFSAATLTNLLEECGFGEIDFSGSPGSDDVDKSWWIVCHCKKIKEL